MQSFESRIGDGIALFSQQQYVPVASKTNKQTKKNYNEELVSFESNELTLGLITATFSTTKTYDSVISNLGWPFRWRFFLLCFSSAYKTGKFKLAPFTRPGRHNTRNVKHARGVEKLQKVFDFSTVTGHFRLALKIYLLARG